jgi:group I intron endonuclease
MTNKIYGIIYKISFPNGKQYIGQTKNSIKQRKGEHISCSRSNKPKYILHKAIKLYGEESFEMIEIANAINKEELNSLEIYYIKENNTYFKNGSGYNMTFGGEGNSGYVFTDEIKKKMSMIKKIYLKNNPEAIKKHKENMKNYWTEEKKLAMSILKKEQHKNNPEIVEKWKKSRGEWSNEERTNHSLLIKEQFKKNPERAKEISKRMKIRANTIEGKLRGKPKPFDVHTLTGEYIGTYNYVPIAINDILNEKKILNNITEKTLGKSIRRVLSGERNHTKGFTFKYKTEV